MATLPQLFKEDIDVIKKALDDFIAKSEATTAMILDKGGFEIVTCGDRDSFDATTLGALAAAVYAATQGIAGLVKESEFSNVYQQGENFSLLIGNIDEHCLLVVIFRAQISVGAVKYYAVNVISQVSQQLQVAHHRSPDEGIDLSVLNVADTSEFFSKKAEPEPDAGAVDPVAKLQKMKSLLENGLITQEDFEAMKRKILEQM